MGRLRYKKVWGTFEPSDVLTKHAPGDLLNAHLKSLDMEDRDGRSVSAPALGSLTVECVSNWIEAVIDRKVSSTTLSLSGPFPWQDAADL